MTLGLFALVVGAGYLGAAWWLDHHGGEGPARPRYDAIIVLGCRVRPDGSASPALRRRTRHAAALYERGLAPRLVLTGGVGDHPPSEARAAAAVAIDAGVPPEALVLEEDSHSTEENAKHAARRIDDRRVLVVTDRYHVFRARRVFQRYFDHVDAVGSWGSRSVRIRGALREVAAVTAYAATGRLHTRR